MRNATLKGWIHPTLIPKSISLDNSFVQQFFLSLVVVLIIKK